jgi:hypothetical protein
MPLTHENIRRKAKVALILRARLPRDGDGDGFYDPNGPRFPPGDVVPVPPKVPTLPQKHRVESDTTMARLAAAKYHDHGPDWPESARFRTEDQKRLIRASLDLLVSGGTAWHIAHPSYKPGDPLYSRDQQPYVGIETPWKWDDAPEGFDGDAVALFPDSPEGREEADWLWYEFPDYVLLRITVPSEHDRGDVEMRLLEEGYPAVIDEIPPEWISVVRRGYPGRRDPQNVLTQSGD